MRRTAPAPAACSLGLAAVAAACGGGGETQPQGGFQLSFLSVPDGELDWPINRPIELYFNQPVDFGTVNANTIRVRTLGGEPALGDLEAGRDSATGEVDERIVVFRPSCPRTPTPFADAGLQPDGVFYEIRVLGHESGPTVLSRAGRPLLRGQTRTFRTPIGLEPSTIFQDFVPGPPRAVIRGRGGVSASEEAATYVEIGGAGGRRVYLEAEAGAAPGLPEELPLNFYSRPESRADVVVVLDQSVDASAQSLSARSVRLEVLDGLGSWRPLLASVELEANCLAPGARVRLRPEGPLPPSADLRLVLGEELRDLAGDSSDVPVQVARVATRAISDPAFTPADVAADELVEDFLVGAPAAESLEDTDSVFAEGRASWGMGRLSASFHFPGSGGPGGDFDFVLRAGETLRFDTQSTLIQSADQTRTTIAEGGLFDVRNFTVEEGATLTVSGPNPFVVLVSGDAVIDGVIDVSGGDGETISGVGLANVPSRGGPPVAGGGAGGQGSPITTGSSDRGGSGFGASVESGGSGVAGLGGAGGETGYSGSSDHNLRRPGGGGGGVFADTIDSQGAALGSDGLRAQFGFDGMDSSLFPPGTFSGVGAFGAISDSSPPMGGAPGSSPFRDGDSDNDFWGLRLDEGGGVTLGELTRLWAGSGGGGGGDAVPMPSFPNPDYVSGDAGRHDQRGGGGGSGGGGFHLRVLGDVSFGPSGQIACEGGAGGRGEAACIAPGFQLCPLNNTGGGGGGGSGGHVVLEAGGFLDLTRVEEDHVVVSAVGGRGGGGLVPMLEPDPFVPGTYPFNRGGDGGPGVVQVHLGGLGPDEQRERVLYPPGLASQDAELARFTSPPALLLAPSFGSRSRGQSEWIALGGASSASGSSTDSLRLRFGGTSGAEGLVSDADGDGLVDALPPLLAGELVSFTASEATARVSAADLLGTDDDVYLRNPALLERWTLNVESRAFEVQDARYEPGGELLALGIAAAGTSPVGLRAGDAFELEPRFFRVVTQGVRDALPGHAEIRIQFQATGGLADGRPDGGGILVDWTGDVEELNREDLEGALAFVRFRVLFEIDAMNQGFAVTTPLPALEFLRIPFAFRGL